MSDLILVTLELESLRAGPGEEIVTSVIVQNAGRVVDGYSITLVGLDTGWYQLSTSSVSLFPGDSAPVGLTIRIPAGTEAVAGPYEFSVSVVSGVSASEETTVVGSLEVTPSYNFEWDIRPERRRPW